MTWWDDLKKILKSEANDAREGLRKLGRQIDDALARKEREQAASPDERIDMLLEETAEEDVRFRELEAKVDAETAAAPEPQPRQRTRMFSDAEVSENALMKVAVLWVDVVPLEGETFDHRVRIASTVRRLVGAEVEKMIAERVAEHALVLDVAGHAPRFTVYAPALHPDDVRAVVAGAFVDHVPDDWEQRLADA